MPPSRNQKITETTGGEFRVYRASMRLLQGIQTFYKAPINRYGFRALGLAFLQPARVVVRATRLVGVAILMCLASNHCSIIMYYDLL